MDPTNQHPAQPLPLTHPSPLRLQKKVAIVTGAASGFGLAITQLFARHGCAIVATDLNQPLLHSHFPADSARQPASARVDGRIVGVVADVACSADWDRVVKTARDRFGGLDIVVNNAGTSYRNKPTLEVTPEDFDRVMTVNVKSVFYSVGACVPVMIEQGRGGAIINVASIGATRPRPGLVWYNASKGAVANATKGLAAEYGSHQIRVNSVCPLLSGTGLFETFVGMKDTPENREKFVVNVPLGRLADPMDVANAALFFASDEGKFVTGINMEVDGGRAI